MATKLCLRRERCDSSCMVQGPGEGDKKKLRPVLAELGMWVIDTADFCGMGVIKDPEGKSGWREYDWGSSDGVAHSKSHNRIAAWLPEDQVPLWAMDTRSARMRRDKVLIKDISGALRFLGGKRCGPLKNTPGTRCCTMSYEQRSTRGGYPQ